MADEAQISATLQFAKGTFATLKRSGTVNADVAGAIPALNVQAVGTSEEALALGDVGTPGYCFMHNLDATNFVDVLPATAVAACIRLLPGDVAVFRFAGAAPFVKADTATVNLEYFLLPA